MRNTFMKKTFKKLTSILMILLLSIGLFPNASVVNAQKEMSFPYAIFASSYEDSAISINSSIVNLNGTMATNGSFESASSTQSQGTKEHLNKDMIYQFNKLDSAFFSSIIPSSSIVSTISVNSSSTLTPSTPFGFKISTNSYIFEIL